MILLTRRVASTALLFMIGACAVPTSVRDRRQADAGSRLRSLLDNSDEAYLDRNPIDALYRGDTRRAARHGDNISRAFVDAERRAAEIDLTNLAEISRDQLSSADRVANDTFR